MLKGVFNLTIRATQGLLDSRYQAAVHTGLQLCQQAGPHGDSGLSTAPKGRHYRSGYRCNRAESVWRRRVEGQKARRRETVSLAQVASGSGPGNPRYRGGRSLSGECP